MRGRSGIAKISVERFDCPRRVQVRLHPPLADGGATAAALTVRRGHAALDVRRQAFSVVTLYGDTPQASASDN